MSVTIANTDAQLSSKTLVTTDANQTIDGLKTYNRGTSAPFAVVSGAAKVANLDADLLDGQSTADYHNATLLDSGTVPTARLGSGTANAGTFLRGDQAWAIAFALSNMPGRLTLTTAVPVTTADVTAATTLYYALYKGNRVALYTGSVWTLVTIAELSIAVPATTSQMYDVFLDYNAGTPVLAVTAWTNDATRATALTTQDGVLVQTGNLDWRYLGSFRTTGVSGQTEDSQSKRFVWNNYNRVRRSMRVLDTTNSWTYSTGAFRQANGSTANQLSIVQGVAEESILVTAMGVASNSGAGVTQFTSIGEDATNAKGANVVSGVAVAGAAGVAIQATAFLNVIPAIGYHYYAWLEWDATGAGTTTWQGDNNGTTTQTGITGSWAS